MKFQNMEREQIQSIFSHEAFVQAWIIGILEDPSGGTPYQRCNITELKAHSP